MLNDRDGIFTGQGGNSSLLSANFIDERLGFSGGVIASITLGINSSSIPDPVQGGGGPPPNPNPPTSTLKSNDSVSKIMNLALILFHFVLLFLY